MVLSRNRYYMSISLFNNDSEHFRMFNILTQLNTFKTNYKVII